MKPKRRHLRSPDEVKRSLIRLADDAAHNRISTLIDGTANLVRSHPLAGLTAAAGMGFVLTRSRFARRMLSLAAMRTVLAALHDQRNA